VRLSGGATPQNEETILNSIQRAATFAATVLVALGAASAQADVTIGVSLPLSGPGSGLGIPIKNQIALWPQTIAGEKLNLIVLDDATDPANGVKNARRFVTDDKVDLILGSAITPVAIAMAPVAAEAETLQLALSPAALPPGKDKWTFRLPQSAEVMAHAVIVHMKKSNVKTVGFIGYNDAYGEVWLNELQAKAPGAGIKVVAVERFARSDTSVTAQALKVVGANPDAVLIVATGSGAAMPQKGLVERGYKGKMYQTHAAATRDLMRIGGKDVEGTWVVSGPALVGELLPDSNPSKNAALDFAQTYEKAYGAGSRNQFAAHSYDAVLLLNRALPIALKKAKPGTKEFRAALRDAFEQLGPLPVSHGVINYTANDHWGFTLTTGVMLKVVNGDWTLEK
jgi:branched-chain amino acid transport system substrate-binding protein